MAKPSPADPHLPRGLRARNAWSLALAGLGLLQITGYLLGLQPVRGLGACTAASPFPKVFSDVNGFETFAADFTMIYEADGAEVRQRITPDYYQQLRGPYWRRNVYGAALSYGPRLPRPLWETILCYGLGEDGPFGPELGVPSDAQRVRILIEARTRGRESDSWILEPECDE